MFWYLVIYFLGLSCDFHDIIYFIFGILQLLFILVTEDILNIMTVSMGYWFRRVSVCVYRFNCKEFYTTDFIYNIPCTMLFPAVIMFCVSMETV